MFSIRSNSSHQNYRRNCELLKEIRKFISKTSTDKNNDMISISSGQNQLKTQLSNMELGYKNRNHRKWLTQVKHNNIRVLSTIQQIMAAPIHSSTLVNKEQSREFMAVFPDIVRELTDSGKNQQLPECMRRITKALQYTVPTGKKNRGLITVMAYKMLEKPELLTPENVRLSQILGWCTEIMQASLLITDDIVDGSVTRRGAPCWYRQPGIGLTACNDALLMQSDVYFLLKNHLKGHPSYVLILELFHETLLKTTIGQTIDTLCCDENKKPKLDLFTMDRYTSITKFKTAYYSFHLPVALAMYLANMTDEEQHRQAKTILLEIGEFFQVQDDFLDCFGDISKTGKVGTDIQEGKCSWLAVVALQRASPAQRRIMEEHYGRTEPESVAIIRQLYEDLCLPNTYAIYEEECYNRITTHIHQISKGLRHDLFFKILNVVYKRVS